MDALNFQWPYERMTQPSLEGALDALTAQVASLSRKIDALESQSVQNAYYQEQADFTPDYYHPDWQTYPSTSWDNEQEQFYDPSLAYPPEFSYQYPPQEEGKSNLEEILAKFIEHHEERALEVRLTKCISQTEVQMDNHDASIQNLGSQVEQLPIAIIDCTQSILPNNTKINPKEEGQLHCNVDNQGDGEELLEVVDEQLKRAHPRCDDDSETVMKKSKNGSQEKGYQEVPFKAFETIKIPSGREECQWVDVVEADLVNGEQEEGSYFLSTDEDKFGGLQFCLNVGTFKEKTKRRHGMENFAIHPD